MNGLSLRDVEALRLVAQHNSFRAAATALDVSPSSLSQIISQLEQRLGVRLVNRTTRSVSLTDAGHGFLQRAVPGMAAIEEAIATARKHRTTPAGRIRLNGSETSFERLMPLLPAFLERYPDISIECVADGLLSDIVGDGFDAGLRLFESVPQDMVALSFGSEEGFALVAAPDYLARFGRPQTPTDLKAHHCIRFLMPSGKLAVWEFEKDGQVTRPDPPSRWIVGTSRLATLAAVSAGGIAYVSAWDARADLAAGRLVRLLDDWTPPFPGLCLYYPRQHLPSMAFRALLDHVKDCRSRDAGMGTIEDAGEDACL